MDKLPGFIAPWGIALLIFILNALLPGRWVTGYVTRTGSPEKLRYRLNGIYVLITILILWFLTGYFRFLPFDWLYRNRWEGLAGACVLGILFSLAVVLPYPRVRKSWAADLFLGRRENMQAWGGRIDAKMWLYLFGAVLLELNVLSFAAHQWITFGEDASPGIFLSAGLLTWFVVDYLTFEEVHLYTYDLFAERVGFKLGWGCLVFYPYFYAIPLWSTVALPDPEFPAGLYGLASILFFAGWSFSRGANLQKYHFKKDPRRSFLGIVPQTLTNGDKSLLINGFWGLSRHINYLVEILMASGIVLAAGHPGIIWPWLYPLYYVALLFTRQADDDRRCRLKYGELWTEYRKRVPYRIIPYIY